MPQGLGNVSFPGKKKYIIFSHPFRDISHWISWAHRDGEIGIQALSNLLETNQTGGHFWYPLELNFQGVVVLEIVFTFDLHPENPRIPVTTKDDWHETFLGSKKTRTNQLSHGV